MQDRLLFGLFAHVPSAERKRIWPFLSKWLPEFSTILNQHNGYSKRFPLHMALIVRDGFITNDLLDKKVDPFGRDLDMKTSVQLATTHNPDRSILWRLLFYCLELNPKHLRELILEPKPPHGDNLLDTVTFAQDHEALELFSSVLGGLETWKMSMFKKQSEKILADKNFM